ncbi:MAG: DUF2089 family protein [Verrucomicrobiota bacterium]
MADGSKSPSWLKHLEESDLAFIKRFVLCSGSLKQVAQEYGVSYPTVRLRLDRLIQKIQVIEEQSAGDDFEILLSTLVTDGKLDTENYRKLHDAYLLQKKKPTD